MVENDDVHTLKEKLDSIIDLIKMNLKNYIKNK